MNISKVEEWITKLKRAINIELKKQNYNGALSLVSVCSNIIYQTNAKYMDSDLEQVVKSIADSAKLNELNGEQLNDDILIFWDGFGLNNRGLCQIYLKALCKYKKVVYITYKDRENLIPDIHSILDENNAERRYVNRGGVSPMTTVHQLNSIIKEFRPKHMFFYSMPDDVVATPLLYAYENTLIRYQINLTDHVYWLGTGCFDKNVNFRQYGARISIEYRDIPKSKNVVIPFYPIINFEREFLGFPFKLEENQKVIFSGGALYKTLGGGNKYYIMVDYILGKYKDVVFWYAGSGDDTELKKILNKYPDRAHYTEERSDLYQVLQHCNIYLSTYPMCGGLMFQYAAMAGIVPVTLKHGNISDEFLMNQKEINIEFDNIDDLYFEVDKLLTDEDYYLERRKQMLQAVISPELFNEEVRKLVSGEISENFLPEDEHIDTESFRQWYLEDLKKIDLAAMASRKDVTKYALKYYPLDFVGGSINLFIKKVKRFLSRRK